jgi:ferrochelatase
MKTKKGLLLINLGTPDDPGYLSVFKYLRQFLMDPKVITVPYILRFILVSLIIVPFRAFSSGKIYKKIWTENGSPLIVNTSALAEKVSKKVPHIEVEFAMRYQSPSIEEKLKKLISQNLDEIIILPLFPQYSTATTGSVFDEVSRVLKKQSVTPSIKFINQFYEQESFIDSWEDKLKSFNIDQYDHILFSYHGLPTKAVDDIYDDSLCADNNCENEITNENKFCYKATCYETTRLIASRFNLSQDKYTVSFQSRLTKNWLEPFTDEVLEEFPTKGIKNILVLSPAFTADNLETLYEIDDEYKELFIENGGNSLTMVPSLNDSSKWADSIVEIIDV